MTNYQDKWTRFHDKPTTNNEPSSNNGYIYSSYSKYLLPNTLDLVKINECYAGCIRSNNPLKIDRNPSYINPVMSKDEIVGLVSLGLLTRDELANSHWNFCNLPYDPQELTFKNTYIAAKKLYSIRNEHRNYFWQNNLTETYILAFYTPPEVQYYVNKFNGYNATLLQTMLFYINFLITFIKGDKSSRMMYWLMCSDLDSFLLKFIPKDRWVKDYFNENHPFVKNLNKKS